MPSKRTTAVVLDDDIKRQIAEIANDETISVSAVVRRALKDYLLRRNTTHRVISKAQKTRE